MNIIKIRKGDYPEFQNDEVSTTTVEKEVKDSMFYDPYEGCGYAHHDLDKIVPRLLDVLASKGILSLDEVLDVVGREQVNTRNTRWLPVGEPEAPKPVSSEPPLSPTQPVP